MQVFCERFLRFIAGEIASPEDWDGCECRERSRLAVETKTIAKPEAATSEDSRLEPFRLSVRITAS